MHELPEGFPMRMVWDGARFQPAFTAKVRLEPGEFVISARAAREHGTDLLRGLNEEKDVD